MKNITTKKKCKPKSSAYDDYVVMCDICGESGDESSFFYTNSQFLCTNCFNKSIENKKV